MVLQAELNLFEKLKSKRPLPVLVILGLVFVILSTPFLVDFVSPGLDLYLLLLALPFCLMVQQKTGLQCSLRSGITDLLLGLLFSSGSNPVLSWSGVIHLLLHRAILWKAE